ATTSRRVPASRTTSTCRAHHGPARSPRSPMPWVSCRVPPWLVRCTSTAAAGSSWIPPEADDDEQRAPHRFGARGGVSGLTATGSGAARVRLTRAEGLWLIGVLAILAATAYLA